MTWWRTTFKTLLAVLMIAVLVVGCSKSEPIEPNSSGSAVSRPKPVAEVSPPKVVQQLHQSLDRYQPQVALGGVSSGEVLQDDTVSIQFQVQGLPIFQDNNSGLGPHLQVILDRQPPQTIYDIAQPLTLSGLEPGTHTLRAFAAYPWGESFKNEGAYAQVTFHVFTETSDNNPDPSLPLITYSEPQGVYGSEPVLLDFYLHNAPLHVVAQESPEDAIQDWRIQATVNGESFMVDQWQPLYIKGIKPGKNWVKLEFLDELGEPLNNVYNNTARLFVYNPKATDFRSRLLRGELSVAQARSVVDPNYIPGTPIPAEPEIAPETEPPLEVPSAAGSEPKKPDQELPKTTESITPPEQTPPAKSEPESVVPREAVSSEDLPPEKGVEPSNFSDPEASEVPEPVPVVQETSSTEEFIEPIEEEPEGKIQEQPSVSEPFLDKQVSESAPLESAPLNIDEQVTLPILESEKETDLEGVKNLTTQERGLEELPGTPEEQIQPYIPVRVQDLPEPITEPTLADKITQRFKGLLNRLPSLGQ
ncbi:MAG: hypothetical protein ACRC8A_07020 [Microcoleaceae cyanobacterium]